MTPIPHYHQEPYHPLLSLYIKHNAAEHYIPTTHNRPSPKIYLRGRQVAEVACSQISRTIVIYKPYPKRHMTWAQIEESIWPQYHI